MVKKSQVQPKVFNDRLLDRFVLTMSDHVFQCIMVRFPLDRGARGIFFTDGMYIYNASRTYSMKDLPGPVSEVRTFFLDALTVAYDETLTHFGLPVDGEDARSVWVKPRGDFRDPNAIKIDGFVVCIESVKGQSADCQDVIGDMNGFFMRKIQPQLKVS